ncbi:MAG: hypothetical protein NDI73_11175 [Desulfuromonadales bacterium]|nr:hypothetical protein [Desulfuromonadales bacterium]
MNKLSFRLTALLICALLFAACQREEPPVVSAVQPQPPAAAPADTIAPPPAPVTGSPATAPAPSAAPTIEPAAPPAGPAVFMERGITLIRGETLADALPVWRRFAAQKPALLLLSNDPALLPPPNELLPRTATLMASGTDEALRAAGNPQQPAPLFLPVMSVDLALRQGWLRELIWAFPLPDPAQEVKLDKLREQMSNNRLIDAEEAASLQLDGKVFSGRLRGMPFRAAGLPDLPKLDGPLIVHIDLSYLQKLYKNEIATPVIPLAGSVLQQLKERRLPVLAVTFSYNHADGNIPMNVRFLGDFISALTEKPERLGQPLPKRWAAQKDILYLENFFQKDEIRKLVEQQAQDSPKTAWVLYNRYHTAGLFKETGPALANLAHTVALDRMYGLEYLTLAQRAFDNKAPDQALKMMRMAAATFPEDPFIKLQTAQLAMENGDKETARQLIRELQKLPWSSVYYPDMPKYLEGFLAELEK